MFARVFVALALALSLGGCSAEQLAHEEAVAHGVLTRLQVAVDWASANPETVKAILEDARSQSSDPGFQKAIDKAEEHVQAGDLAAARAAVLFGAVLTTPAPAPASAPK